MNNRGTLVTADIYVNGELPPNAGLLRHCEDAIAASGMTVISAAYKAFEPHGLTAVWLLCESHFAIHTYPEHNYLSVDCYTCGSEGNAAAAIGALCARLDVADAHITSRDRGAKATDQDGNAP